MVDQKNVISYMWKHFLLVDICLGCGDINISVAHPLFHGSLCEECKVCITSSITPLVFFCADSTFFCFFHCFARARKSFELVNLIPNPNPIDSSHADTLFNI